MARPIKKAAEYFPHFVGNAEVEKYVNYLVSMFGGDGYMFYYRTLEYLARSDYFRVDLVPLNMAALCRHAAMSMERYKEILDTALEIGAFDRDEHDCLYNSILEDVLQPLLDKREKMRDRYRSQQQESAPDENQSEGQESAEDFQQQNEAETPVSDNFCNKNTAETPVSDAETPVSAESTQQRKGKKRKEKERKEDRPLTFNEQTARWNSLQKSGLITLPLQILNQFPPGWDERLHTDLKKHPPPDKRITLIEIVARCLKYFSDEGRKILAARDWIERNKPEYMRIDWLFDVHWDGKYATDRIERAAEKQAIGNDAEQASERWLVTNKFVGYCDCGAALTEYVLKRSGKNKDPDVIVERMQVCRHCNPDKAPVQIQQPAMAAG